MEHHEESGAGRQRNQEVRKGWSQESRGGVSSVVLGGYMMLGSEE